MSRSVVLTVSTNFKRIEKNERSPADTGTPAITAAVRVSRRGLKIPIRSAKGETSSTFFRMNRAGIPPRVISRTGKRKKGTSAATSYLGRETTVRR